MLIAVWVLNVWVALKGPSGALIEINCMPGIGRQVPPAHRSPLVAGQLYGAN